MPKIQDQNPMFDQLPKKTEEQARKVWAICRGHIGLGPNVLVKSVSAKDFHHWLNQSKLWFHKAVHLDSDTTVYVVQECCEDHGTLRGLITLLHFNITNPASQLTIDLFVRKLDGLSPESLLVPVVFEIGM